MDSLSSLLSSLDRDSFIPLLSKLIGESLLVQNNLSGLILQEDLVACHILDVLLPLSTSTGGGPLSSPTSPMPPSGATLSSSTPAPYWGRFYHSLVTKWTSSLLIQPTGRSHVIFTITLEPMRKFDPNDNAGGTHVEDMTEDYLCAKLHLVDLADLSGLSGHDLTVCGSKKVVISTRVF